MTSSDRTEVHAVARRVGFTLALTSALMVVIGVAAMLLAIIGGSRHEILERGGTADMSRSDSQDVVWVLDRDKAIAIVIVAGIAAIVCTGLMGWLAARRAVRPLGEALDRQRRFVADASHELRTPLTVLSTRAQLLRHRLERGEPIDDLVDALDRDAEALSGTLDDLLLATTGGGNPTPVDVVSAARRTVESLAPLADKAEVTITVAADRREIFVLIPSVSFDRCLLALLDNAIRHSPRGTEIRVQIQTRERRCVIDVVDQGRGIVGISPDRVFERFAHTSSADSTSGHPSHGSFGIGLALVREVVEKAGGSASVASTGPRGTAMRIELPLLPRG